MKTTAFRSVVIGPALALVAAGAVFAGEVPAILGSGGAIVQLQSGSYGDLFPGSSLVEPDNPVLVLDVDNAVTRERWLVPGTETSSGEIPAALLFESDSDTTFLLWQTFYNGVHPLLYFTGFDGSQWSEVIEIPSNVFATKGEPQIVALRDKGHGDSDRTTVCIAWWEQDGSSEGSYKFMVPLVLENGTYLGWAPRLDLGGLTADKQLMDAAGAADRDLTNLLRIQPGLESQSAIIGFTDSESGRLMTLRVEMLPAALSELAAIVVEVMATEGIGLPVDQLADLVGRTILEHGQQLGFHPATLAYLAEDLRAIIGAEGGVLTPENASEIVPKRGIRIMHDGARIGLGGLQSQAPTEIVGLAPTRDGGPAYHHIATTLLTGRRPPEVGGPATLFLSRDGYDALVAWDGQDMVHYRQTEGTKWTGVHSIRLRPGLDREAVYEILADRVR